MWDVSTAVVVPIVVSANGLIANSVDQNLRRLSLGSWIKDLIQKAVLLDTARIFYCWEVPLSRALTTGRSYLVPSAAFVVLAMTAYSNMANIDSLENDKFIVKTIGRNAAVKIRGLENDENSPESFNSFIEEKLMHQNQALEHLIKAVDSSGDMIKKLIENLSKGLEKPKLPTKAEPAEVPQIKRRNNNSRDNSRDNPVVRLGKNIPKYGKLAKDLIMKDNSGTDPTPLIEDVTNLPLLQPGSRRSLGGEPSVSPSQQSDDTQVNPWCPLALLCQNIEDPVCGFDDEFGYGRFENFCHLLRVNCYWKYNFSVVYSCRPKL